MLIVVDGLRCEYIVWNSISYMQIQYPSTSVYATQHADNAYNQLIVMPGLLPPAPLYINSSNYALESNQALPGANNLQTNRKQLLAGVF